MLLAPMLGEVGGRLAAIRAMKLRMGGFFGF